jgi:hypothetical protein
MTAPGERRARIPFTIPLASGPVGPWLDRAVAVLCFALGVAGFLALWGTTPSAKGFDTHVQFGMAPCGWPQVYGVPCPTCGCTTAASHVVHGEILQAFVAQPFGASLTIVGLLLALHAARCLVQRRSFVDLLVRVPLGRILGGAFVFLLAAWYYKYLVFPR